MFDFAAAHFRIGNAHEKEGSPCQDYATARAATEGGISFAVVGDGCSSSGRTDVGSRAIVLAASEFLSKADVLRGSLESARDALRDAAMSGAIGVAGILGLNAYDLDSTLAVVAGASGEALDAKKTARALLFGDGLVAARYESFIDVQIVDWAGNMPGYPMYLSDAARMEAFVRESEAYANAEGRDCCVVRRYRIEQGVCIPVGEISLGAREGLLGAAFEWDLADGPVPEIVAVMTDGASQISGIPWHDAVMEMTAVKASRRGEFMERRMSKALAKFAAEGGRPTDDVSVGAIAA